MARLTKAQKLARRLEQSAIVARMTLTILKAMQSDYRHAHIGKVAEELMATMVLRVNDHDGGAPMTIQQIADQLNISWSSTKGYVLRSVKRGPIKSNGKGRLKTYIGNRTYVAKRVDAEYFQIILKAIRRAFRELEELESRKW